MRVHREPIPAAEAHLPRNLCPLIKASYGFALTDTCPYFYFSDFIIGETTCDGKRKMFELLDEIKPTYVMQLPPSKVAPHALESWKAEMVRLRRQLEEFYGIEITDEAIREAIRRKNRERDVMLRFMELGKLNPAALSGYEIGTRLDASAFSFDLEERCNEIEARTREVLESWEKNVKRTESRRPRLLVTGCPNTGVRDKIIKAVEEMGADVVCFDACNGLRDKLRKVDESKPVMDALAEKYLDITCSVMSPNPQRLTDIGDVIDQYEVDGVIEIILQTCHTYNIEAYEVKRYVTEHKGKPRADIAAGVVDSVASKVATLCSRQALLPDIYLTGGLCHSPYFISRLSDKLGRTVRALPDGHFAGTLGASLLAEGMK